MVDLSSSTRMLIDPPGRVAPKGWRKMVPPFEGKTERFQKKVTKKNPKTGSGRSVHFIVISQFFHEFPGFLEIQVEMPRAGKRGEAGHYAPRKNHKKSGMTGKQTLALGNLGSLKKRRLRRNYSRSDFGATLPGGSI